MHHLDLIIQMYDMNFLLALWLTYQHTNVDAYTQMSMHTSTYTIRNFLLTLEMAYEHTNVAHTQLQNLINQNFLSHSNGGIKL